MHMCTVELAATMCKCSRAGGKGLGLIWPRDFARSTSDAFSKIKRGFRVQHIRGSRNLVTPLAFYLFVFIFHG